MLHGEGRLATNSWTELKKKKILQRGSVENVWKKQTIGKNDKPATRLTVFFFAVHSFLFNLPTGLDVPMDLTVTASTDNTITLVWGVVQGPIDHYMVTFTSSSGVTTEVKTGIKNI